MANKKAIPKYDVQKIALVVVIFIFLIIFSIYYYLLIGGEPFKDYLFFGESYKSKAERERESIINLLTAPEREEPLSEEEMQEREGDRENLTAPEEDFLSEEERKERERIIEDLTAP